MSLQLTLVMYAGSLVKSMLSGMKKIVLSLAKFYYTYVHAIIKHTLLFVTLLQTSTSVYDVFSISELSSNCRRLDKETRIC